MEKEIEDILNENERRKRRFDASLFNPVTGEGSILERRKVVIEDFPLREQWLPLSMLDVPLVRLLLKHKTIDDLLVHHFHVEPVGTEREKVIKQLVRLRCRHDFAFWAAVYVWIKRKGGGSDIHFRLNYAQRKLITCFEEQRLAGLPIRLVLLKARQWGGSTATQIYMAWLQLCHKEGLNSLIVAHVKDTAIGIKDMFDRMITSYPSELLYPLGASYDPKEPKMTGVGNSINTKRVPQRNCLIKIGSAETPDSARGQDYNLVHCSEVGLWKTTEGKSPEEIVRSACSGVLTAPYTMIVYESTANGTGNFFHLEYLAAKKGASQFRALFIPWYEIEHDTLELEDATHFARQLWERREVEEAADDRSESGKYLWWLWQQGATLEGINWYISERTKHTDHGSMASECPTNDVEAFTFSGRKVFADEDIDQLRPGCRSPKKVGEIYGAGDTGADALRKVRFKSEPGGRLWIWQDVERDAGERVLDRYLVVVDVCKGHSAHADYSVITVFDRLLQIDGGKPVVVAQWYGRIDMDLLAWKAAQVAYYYDEALLVIESNTLETSNTKGEAEYILNIVREVYDNLYMREQSAEDIREGAPRKYGFHTNTLTKKVIIHNLKTVIREGLYIERDERCLAEYATYVETERGGYEAKQGYHDDLLMTRAIGLYISMTKMALPRIVELSSPSSDRANVEMTEAVF